MLTICVPEVVAEAFAAEPVADVEVIVWNGAAPVPDNLGDVEVWVPAYMSAGNDERHAALAAMPKLRLIQLLSAGVDSWLSAVPDGVTLANGRGVHGSSTAELALALLMATLRELPRFLDQQRRGEWAPDYTEGLGSKRVLVLGAGDIGDRIAEVCRVLDAEVSVVARTARDGVHAFTELPELLPRHDVVVIAVPLTEQTRGLVDAAFLAALPDHALVINVARGPVLVTDALVAELQAGRLRAGLDVTDPEPLPAGHPLWQAPNLLLTPHIAGGTTGWQQRAARLVYEQVGRLLAEEPLRNVVQNGY